jgi:transposase
MLMAPLVRRSWSERGQTPVLRQRGRSHQKVSAIAAIRISPNRDQVSLYYRLHPEANINSEHAMDFLENLQRQLGTPIVLIWDNFAPHKDDVFNECVLPGSAHIEYLPPYVPELNPVEYLWAWLKMNPSVNDAAAELQHLVRRTHRAARSAQRRQNLLRGFLDHTGLPLLLK